MEKRAREKHTSQTAPDINRCLESSLAFSVLSPVSSCINTLSRSSFRVLCITTQHPPRVPKGRSEPWSADPESSHSICSLSQWVLPSSLLPQQALQGDPWVLQWDPGSPGFSPWLPAALPMQQVELPQAWKPLRFLVPSGARVPPDPGDCEMTGGGSSRPGCLLSPLPELAQPRPHPSLQFSCDLMDCSMPGFPVHHQLLEFTQTHVH